MQDQSKIVVIGGGLVGLATAVQLARARRPVLLIDSAPATPPASWGNAGIIAVEQVEPLATPATLRGVLPRLFTFGGPVAFRPADIAVWAPFVYRFLRVSTVADAAHGKQALQSIVTEALPAWERLAQTLGDTHLVIQRGQRVLWESERSAKRQQAHWAITDTGDVRVSDLDASTLQEMNAKLSRRVVAGLQLQGTAQVASPARALLALRACLLASGGECMQATVTGLGSLRGRIQVTLESGETWQPEAVLVAAGVGSKTLMKDIGLRVPLIAERGYHIEADVGDWELPPVVFEDRALCVTQFGSRLRATSFVEFARAGSAPDPRKWQRLRRHATELGLPFKGPLSEWMGARPTLPDYLPAMGRSRQVSNLYYAFGHQHLGLTLSAISAELMCDLINGRMPAVDMRPFDVDRLT